MPVNRLPFALARSDASAAAGIRRPDAPRRRFGIGAAARRLPALLSIGFSLAALVMPLPASARDEASPLPPPVVTIEGITEHRLPNGLTILLGPDVLERLPEVLSAPIASDRHPELNPGFEIPAYAGMTESMRHPGLDPGSHAGADVLLVMDDRPMERAGESLKPLVEGILAEAGRSVRRVVLADPHGLHTTPAMIDRVREELSPARSWSRSDPARSPTSPSTPSTAGKRRIRAGD